MSGAWSNAPGIMGKASKRGEGGVGEKYIHSHLKCSTVPSGKNLLLSPFILIHEFLIFFRRNRAIPLGESPYSIVPGSIQFSDSIIDVQILNNKTNVVLSLQVIILQHNTVRFKINEINPIHQRYEVQDVLVGEPTHSRQVMRNILG